MIAVGVYVYRYFYYHILFFVKSCQKPPLPLRQLIHINMEKKIETRRHFMNCDIAGFTYWDGCMAVEKLKIGTTLQLVRDEDNKFDPYAVAIYLDDLKLGYIPRGENHDLSKFLEMGYEGIFEVRVNKLDLDEHPEEQVGIIVYIKRKES